MLAVTCMKINEKNIQEVKNGGLQPLCQLYVYANLQRKNYPTNMIPNYQ